MSELVPRSEIEQIVGANRHEVMHIGRLVRAERRVFVLHSEHCVKTHADLRECEHSRALDRRIRRRDWAGLPDRPVALRIVGGRLAPVVRGDGLLRILTDQVAAFERTQCSAPGVGVHHPGTHRPPRYDNGGPLPAPPMRLDPATARPQFWIEDERRHEGE
ncbi:hypothetical protein K8P10_001970 [Leucobacter sp. Psy1]|uniref:hypothetical protein n=1 Tax=Leucobacter sp. Psy1 TaxID=2875729 RepID=UPI001CD738B4|nr:hypothetical protein [Leucobacter sp. Psy1]UBH06459.1 hypothetical protein K8P10_001970 [Leucobacter sp. Psy1]